MLLQAIKNLNKRHWIPAREHTGKTGMRHWIPDFETHSEWFGY